MRRLVSIQSLLWVALVLALVGSLRHVAWGFSTLEHGDLIAGYVQAIAVDLGLFGLALGIQTRKRHGRPIRGLWVGVILFSAVSTYANLLHGFYFQTDLGLGGLGWLVSIRPVILSGVLPLLVVYLSEIAGDDVNHAAKLAERDAKRQVRDVSTVTATAPADVQTTTGLDATPEAAERARLAKAEQDAAAKAQRVDKLLALCRDNPDMGVTELANAIGVSRTAIYNYVGELETAGRLHRNGKGWEVATA